MTETSESLSELDVELVRLKQNPDDQNLLGNIFRLVQTIKGTSGFLGLPRLEAVAHASENVLGKVRDGVLEVTPTAVTLILESIDQIKHLLNVLEETEAKPEGEDRDLIFRLNQLAEGQAAPAAPEPEPEPEPEVATSQFSDVLGSRPGEVPLDELERIFNETEVLVDVGGDAPDDNGAGDDIAAQMAKP